jgi:hypothetical protein
VLQVNISFWFGDDAPLWWFFSFVMCVEIMIILGANMVVHDTCNWGANEGLIDLIANDSNHMIVGSTWVGIDEI